MASTPTKAAPPSKEPATAPAQPKRPSLADQSDILRGMWYGDPGKGKTTAIAQMAKLGRIKFIDPERRLKPSALKRQGVPIDNIDVPIVEITYTRLEDLAFEIQESLDKGEPIVGLAWDAVGENAMAFKQALVDKAVSRAAAAGKERNPYSTELADWGDMTEQMRRILRRFRDLPIHLGVTAHAQRDQDEEGGVLVTPALSPAVYRDFMGYMDTVIHCRVELVEEKEEYSGLCRPSGKWIAKDAFGVMPRVLVNPTFDRVLAIVQGTLDYRTDPLQVEAKAARERMAAAAAAAA